MKIRCITETAVFGGKKAVGSGNYIFMCLSVKKSVEGRSKVMSSLFSNVHWCLSIHKKNSGCYLIQKSHNIELMVYLEFSQFRFYLTDFDRTPRTTQISLKIEFLTTYNYLT